LGTFVQSFIYLWPSGTGGFDFNFGDLFGSGSRNAGPRTGGMGSIFEQMFGGMGGNNVKFNSNFGAGTI
jgi:hypothetical protein